ncbi:MAG TPA: GNAT family N-acetyltransferase [Opitutaceae bacterium]|nr:GNAT family N-acetyltransferase [Opitutaceae bacterium]
MEFSIRPVTAADGEWIRRSINDRWGAEVVVVHGVIYHPHRLPGLIAETPRGERVGLATYLIENAACELVTLDSFRQGQGVGSALVRTLAQEAGQRGCSRLWCVTTNDNLPALRFYQQRGFAIIATHADAVERARALKPAIPLRGVGGVPIRDEIELELALPSG